jgi:hypothetical protein
VFDGIVVNLQHFQTFMSGVLGDSEQITFIRLDQFRCEVMTEAMNCLINLKTSEKRVYEITDRFGSKSLLFAVITGTGK